MAQFANAAASQPRNGATTSVLVVDDDVLNNQVVARRLTQEGFSVATAQSGLEALHTLDRQVFDLVLLDLEMPGMDGIETLKRIRAHKRAVATPVIMLSSHKDSASINNCLENGAADYLFKPLVIPLVRARIERCLRPGNVLSGDDSGKQGQASASQAASILVVDDDELNCRLLVRQLQSPGFHVSSVSNAQAALEWLAQKPADVVLLDVNMPGMSGTDLLQALRSNEATRYLPVIMVTGSNDVSVMLKCIDHGADGYITKPVDISYLRSCILSAVEARKLGPAMTINLD